MVYKISRNVVLGAFVLFAGAGMFAGGFVTGANYQATAADPNQVLGIPGLSFDPDSSGTFGQRSSIESHPVDPELAGTPADLSETFKPFWEAWTLLHENFYEQPLDDQELAYGAIRGMLAATRDRHTVYMTPAQYDVMQSDLEGELEGIGAEVEQFGDFIRIVSPLPGSAAEEAGLLPGDIIVEVDGEDIFGLNMFDVITKVRGPAGTPVLLGIDRASEEEILYFSVERYRITLPMVSGEVLPSGVGYVKINQFGENTAGQLSTNLEQVVADEPPGIIVDLRNNPGGLLSSSISVLSQFFDGGTVVIQEYSDGRQQELTARSGGLATDIPLVVLINEGSASASEIVAGAIQDYKRGLIVGETSFGKGTVQNLISLTDDNGALRITFSRWLTPDGHWVHNEGVIPDFPVERTLDDRTAGLDPQLDTAVDLILRGAAALPNASLALGSWSAF